MNLPLPNLDDRTYAEIVAEAIAQIPLECPAWTDHNPTDTGIILIELMAWLTEMTLYRVDRLPDENYANFISLLRGEQWNLPNDLTPPERHLALQAEIQKTLLELRDRYRGVTTDDYEQLVLQDWNQTQDETGLKIARVKCLPQRNLDNKYSKDFAKGHISLVVIPQNNSPENYVPLWNFLAERKLLTTCIHIVEPEYVSIEIEANLIIEDGYEPEEIKKNAEAEAKLFFAPLNSGKYWQGTGWDFGRSIYLSELYKLLDDLPGVDYVEDLKVKDISQGTIDLKVKDTYQGTIDLKEHELVQLESSTFTAVVKIGNERKKI